MKKLLLITLFFFTFLIHCYAKSYQYSSYNEILDKMKELSHKHPRYCKLVDIRKENKHISNTLCGKTSCEYWYLTISDFNAPVEHTNNLPQVFFMGGVHGDEAIGPNIVINLADYLLHKNKEDEDITNLIRSRVIILLPLANPSGYYYNIKEEKQKSKEIIDSNKDFLYNFKSKQCFNSASEAIISHIYKTHPIQAAIAFQQGDQSITYPCGAVNQGPNNTELRDHQAQECPNDKAYFDIARILSKEAGANPYLFIKPFTTRKVTDTAFSSNEGLQDWASVTNSKTQLLSDSILTCDDIHQKVPIPSLIYHIGTSGFKQPPVAYLGSSEGLDVNEDFYAYGYIPMNIKLSLTLLDIVEPYVKIKLLYYSEEKKSLTVQWQGSGCEKVDETYLEWKGKEGDLAFSKRTIPKQGPGYYGYKDYIYEETIHLNSTKFDMDFTIKMVCDQNWGLQNNPRIGFQTHVAQIQTNQDYNTDVDDYKVIGKRTADLNVKDLTPDYFMRQGPSDIKNLSLDIKFQDCSNLGSIGSLSAHIIDTKNISALHFKGELGVEGLPLEGHLYKYGDISHCLDTIGERVNTMNLQDTKDDKHSLLFRTEEDEREPEQVNYKLSLRKKDDVLNIIGRSILLRSKDHLDKIFLGQIVPMQPDSCKHSIDMKNCRGVSLGSHDGICVMNFASEDSTYNLKLLIQSSIDGLSLIINGFVPNQIISQYNNFEEIFVAHGDTEKRFSINQQSIPGFGLIEENSFNLHPNVALGTILRVYGQASGERVLLGDCSIVLRDPNFNETQYIIDQNTHPLSGDTPSFDGQTFSFGLAVLALVLIIMIIGFLVRRFKQRKQNFEEETSVEKDNHTNPAQKGIGIIGDSGSNPQMINMGDCASPSLALGLVDSKAFNNGIKQAGSPKKVASPTTGDYVVFPEELGTQEAML